jgi:hypothetical protein
MFPKCRIKWKTILHLFSTLILITHPILASFEVINSDTINNLNLSNVKSQTPGQEQLSAAIKILKLDYGQASLQQIQHAKGLLEQAMSLGSKEAMRILADLLFVHHSCLLTF